MVPYSSGVETYPHGRFMAGRGANHTSQFGEDGLIEAAIERFGAVNQWCFEVGAADGLFFSNTFRLRQAGWKSVLIESDAQRFAELERLADAKCHVVNDRIGAGDLDRIFPRFGVPANLDFGVIDIDGQDFWAWDGLRDFRPRMILVEFDYGSEGGPDFVPAINGVGQASLKAIERLGREKGYEPLARTTVNLLFADAEIL